MRRHQPTRARAFSALYLLSLTIILAACTKPPAEGHSSPMPFSSGSRAASSHASSSPHDLSQDEAAGGHTLRKHVGRTDDQLRERLDHEQNISAASTWNDRASAEAAIGSALAGQNEKISRWLDRDRHPNLVLDYDGDPAHPFGRTLRRGENQVEPCAHAVIVLKWDPPNNYHVLTAYPECRS